MNKAPVWVLFMGYTILRSERPPLDRRDHEKTTLQIGRKAQLLPHGAGACIAIEPMDLDPREPGRPGMCLCLGQQCPHQPLPPRAPTTSRSWLNRLADC